LKEKYLETIKAVDGVLYNLEYHQKRYSDVVNSLGSGKVKNLAEYLCPPKKGFYRCRLVYDTQDIFVEYYPYEPKKVKSLKLVYDDTIEYTKKSTDRTAIDALYALKGEADDILIVKNAYVSDTSIANIAFFKDGVWYTPKNPLLKGTTRARLLDEGVIVEEEITVDMLEKYSKVALFNAMIDFTQLPKCEFLI